MSQDESAAAGGIFISHAHADREIACELAAFVRECLGLPEGTERITCTSDDRYGLTKGENLRRQIEDRLKDAESVILLASPNSKGKDWVDFECGFAAARQKRLFVAMLTGLDADAVPDPHRDSVRVTLSRATDVWQFARALAGSVHPPLPEPKAKPGSLARLVESAREMEEERSREAGAQARRSAEAAFRRERFALWAVAGIALLLVAAGSVWMSEQQDDHERAIEQLTATKERECANLRSGIPLEGRIRWNGANLGQAEVALYISYFDGAEPLVRRRTDSQGVFSFRKDELKDLKPDELVDLAIKHSRFPDVETRKIRPCEAGSRVIELGSN